jgi:hypothetical protein
VSDFQLNFEIGDGYWPNQRPSRSRPRTAIKGRDFIINGDGYAQVWNGMLSTAMAGATTAMLIENDPGGINGSGTVIGFRGNSVLFIGSGTVIRAGTSIGVATTSLQILIGGSTYVMGLDPPSAPVIPAPSGAGKCEGVYSFRLTYFRSVTGEESNHSAMSNIVVCSPSTSGTISVPIPTAAGQPGVDRVRIYASRAGFGAIGPHLFLQETSSLGSSVVVSFYDADLTSVLSPYNRNKPPTGTHVATIGGIIIVMGCFGGYGLSPSIQAYPGAHDFTQVMFLKPGQPITGVKGDGLEGYVVVSCADSIHGVLYAPSPASSILSRVISSNVGFPTSNSWTVIGGEIWGVSGQRGFVRSGGDGNFDSTFAYPILSDLDAYAGAGWVVGHDPGSDMVVFANGTKAWAYNRGAEGHVWSAPLTLPGTVQSAVTAGGKLLLVIGGTLYQFNAGSGPVGGDAQVTPVFQDNGDQASQKQVHQVAVDANGPVTYKVLTDLSLAGTDAPLVGGVAVPGAGSRHGGPQNTLVNGRSFSFDFRMAGAGTRIDSAAMRGVEWEDWTV